MKILKIILIVIVVLVILVVGGLLIFIKTFDINRYKPQIIQQANAALGRDVGMGQLELNFSLAKGVSLGVKDFTIADDPQFSTTDFLKVDSVNVGVNVAAYLESKQISVTGVTINGPKITVIKRGDGVMNVSNIGPAKAQGAASAPGAQSADATTTSAPSVSPAALPAIMVDSIEVKNGNITYIDQSFTPPMTVNVSDATLRVSDFSLTAPFKFSAQAKVMSNSQNVNVEGTAQVNAATSQFHGQDIRITTDLAKLDLLQLKALPQLKDASLPETLAGKVQVDVSEVKAGPQGLEGLKVEGGLEGGMTKLKELAVPVEDIRAAFAADIQTININDFSLGISGGTVKGKAVITDYMSQQGFSFDSKLEGVSLAELIDQSKQPVKMQGKAYGQFQAQGQGFDPNVMMNSLTGQGQIEIKEGRIIDVNILKTVLEKMSMVLPNVAQNLEQKLPEKYKAKLTQKDTVLNQIKLDSSVANNIITIKSAEVSADEFILTSQGQAGFDQTVNMKASFAIPKDLTASMVEVEPQLKTLVDDQQQIFIPVNVKWPSAIPVAPDLEYLGQRIIATKGMEELDKVLDKVFEKDEAPGTGPDGQPVPEEEKPAEREIIEGILDNIFKSDSE